MTTQTDNSFLHEKVLLRLETINRIKKETINVLECFAGDGYIWTEVKLQSSKKINILRIDQKKDKTGVYLIGDNLKYLSSINLNYFDIIDLDAYGIPFYQMEIVFQKGFKGFVHVTAIQSTYGNLPFSLFDSIGIPERMYKKSVTLFSKKGKHLIFKYLQKKGVENLTGFFIEKKYYFCFKIG